MRILRKPRVLEVTGFKTTMLHEAMNPEPGSGFAADPFPRPIQLSVKTPGWLEHEVIEWLERRRDERDSSRAVEHHATGPPAEAPPR